MRIALGLSYKGSAYNGWQIQPNVPTVQECLESSLHQFLNEEVATVCAGRTDAGVHALCQVVHLDTLKERANNAWVKGLNALLPPDIRVSWACRVSDDFHARFSAKSRKYLYVLRNHGVRSPFHINTAGTVFKPLDINAMMKSSKFLLGEHDFSAFRSSQCQAKSPIRIVHDISIRHSNPYVFITFHANAFLHHMIRNIVGALVDIGLNRFEPEWIKEVLESGNRSASSATFSPAGLYMIAATYDEFNLPFSSDSWNLLYELTGIKA